jgi:hypothetical protein
LGNEDGGTQHEGQNQTAEQRDFMIGLRFERVRHSGIGRSDEARLPTKKVYQNVLILDEDLSKLLVKHKIRKDVLLGMLGMILV